MKRYTTDSEYHGMIPLEDGTFCLYSDAKELEDRIKVLEENLEFWKQSSKEWRAGYIRMGGYVEEI